MASDTKAMALQGSSINLQGGGTISVQGSNYNPQPAGGINIVQPASSNGILIQGNNPNPAPKVATPAYTPPATIASSYTPTPVPILPNFDISKAYNDSLTAATQAQNPVYAQMLNDYVNKQNVALTAQQTQTANANSALDTALSQLQTDTGTQESRATQDNATNVANLRAQQAYTAQTQGLTFDNANRALNSSVAANGLSGSGIGQGQIGEGQIANRLTSNEGVRQEATQETAQNTTLNRTFEDLGTALTRQTSSTTTQKQNNQVDLENFISGQAADLQSEKDTEEAQKQAAITSQANSTEQQLVQKWLQSLNGNKAYTPADIALAAQVYG